MRDSIQEPAKKNKPLEIHRIEEEDDINPALKNDAKKAASLIRVNEIGNQWKKPQKIPVLTLIYE